MSSADRSESICAVCDDGSSDRLFTGTFAPGLLVGYDCDGNSTTPSESWLPNVSRDHARSAPTMPANVTAAADATRAAHGAKIETTPAMTAVDSAMIETAVTLSRTARPLFPALASPAIW